MSSDWLLEVGDQSVIAREWLVTDRQYGWCVVGEWLASSWLVKKTGTNGQWSLEVGKRLLNCH